MDTERPTLVAVAASASSHGWPTHATRLSRTLYRYLDGGHNTDALTHHTAADIDDRDQQARAHQALGNLALAHEYYQHALALYTDLDLPEAGKLRADLAALDDSSAEQR